MAKTSAKMIMRQSIHAMTQHHRTLAPVAGVLAFPFSASLLLSQALIAAASPPIIRSISLRFRLLFVAGGLPASSFSSILTLNLAQSIFSFVFTLPFAVTFMIAARASVVLILHGYPRYKSSPPPFSAIHRLFPQMLLTNLCNYGFVLSVNAIVFSVVFVAVNSAGILIGEDSFHSSSPVFAVSATVVYSVAMAFATVACNLASIISAVEDCGSAVVPLMKAWVAIKGNSETALLLALSTNLGMAAVEALFQYRVVKPRLTLGGGGGDYSSSSATATASIWEGFSIAYMHSMLVVLDVAVGFMFLKSSKPEWFRRDDDVGQQKSLTA